MINIKVITGSVRPNRFNIQPASWIFSLLEKREDVAASLLDLKEIDLPFLDEPKPPKQQEYMHQHTKDWSQLIQEADGYIWVTPEYNHSYSPVLKNALDYLFYEWHYKPVAFISYGSQAGGSRAVEHLRLVAAELKMYDLGNQILLPNYWQHLNDKGEYQFTPELNQRGQTLIDELTFWAKQFHQAREEMNKP